MFNRELKDRNLLVLFFILGLLYRFAFKINTLKFAFIGFSIVNFLGLIMIIYSNPPKKINV